MSAKMGIKTATSCWPPRVCIERTPFSSASSLRIWLRYTPSEPQISPACVTISSLAKDSGLPRETLYKAFGDNGNPTLETIMKVAKALGMRLTVAS